MTIRSIAIAAAAGALALGGLEARADRGPARGGLPVDATADNDASVKRDRVSRRAGRAFHLERRPDEQELVGLVGDQLREIQVLQVKDSTLGHHLDVAAKTN